MMAPGSGGRNRSAAATATAVAAAFSGRATSLSDHSATTAAARLRATVRRAVPSKESVGISHMPAAMAPATAPMVLKA